MKKHLSLVVIVILVFISSSCGASFGEDIAPTEGGRVYDADFIKKYESTLNAMFDNNWTLTSTEEKYEEHEPLCDHVDTRPQQFIEWTVEYYDGNDELRTFTFDNRGDLANQVETYVNHYIADYYKEKLFTNFSLHEWYNRQIC